MKTRELSGNELSELRALMNRIQKEINTFSHVSEFLPKSLTNQIEKFEAAIEHEYERRENEL